MKLKVIISGVILGLILFSSCKKDEENTEIKEIELTNKQQSFVESGNDFSFNLLKKISESEADANFMISPLSVNYALAMTANGTRNNTQTQMLNTLGYDSSDITAFNEYFHFLIAELENLDANVELSIANSIWYDDGFSVLQSFLDVNQQYYNAEVSALDFSSNSAVTTINNWVASHTNNKITEIIDNIGPDVVMYLINAVYFYGGWTYQFDVSQTQDASFNTSNANTIQVPTMKMQADLKYFAAGEMQMAELPYGRGNFVMDVILPASGQTTDDVISNLDSDMWIEWINGLYTTDVVLSMPKFKFEFEKELKDCLAAMGMPDLFNSSAADLSGINGSGGLYASKVKHKTYIDVNEEGTEAAAVTAVEVLNTSVSTEPQPIYIYLNRPFIFIIREVSTGAILFSGVVKNPLEE